MIQVHVAALLLAWLIGTWQLFLSRRGSAAHRVLGLTFIALMVLMALVSLLIRVGARPGSFFGLDTLHWYVPLILILCALALYGARTHRIRLHRFAVVALYFGSIVMTGVVQVFLGTGLTHRMFFH